MGMRASRMCKRCYATAVPGTALCEQHTAQPETRKRSELRPLYCCKLWRVTTRNAVLARDPICAWIDNGERCPRLATDIDHIIDAHEWVAQGRYFYDMDNLRGLCHGHHSRRTARDGYGREGDIVF
jgi:hypothetical protein